MSNPLCECGCGQEVVDSKKRYIARHHLSEIRNISRLPFCNCGCGKRVTHRELKY
jgi:hypothetical protein